jgi:predicted Zn-dependent protease
LDKKFFESTRYAIDELLLSGQILFNEELSVYLNKVAKYTLSGEKELLNQLRFYVLKSTEVNAYSTDQGIIFFTTGLLAQLENEAQLAYIIAHEASHFILKHVREGYVEGKEIRSGTGNMSELIINLLSVK